MVIRVTARSQVEWQPRFEESTHAFEEHRRTGNYIFLHMTGCRAPGLEQGNDDRALAKSVIRRTVRLRRALGCAHAFGLSR